MLKLISAIDMHFDSVKDYCSSFNNTIKDYNSYIFYLAKNSKLSYFEYLNTANKLFYYLIDSENPDYILGYGSINDTIDCHIPYYNLGNISYGVRPNERNKGYATMMLRLLLLECEKLGMIDVCVSCNKENLASKKVILKNGGILEKQFFDELDGEGLKFWIKLNPERNRSK